MPESRTERLVCLIALIALGFLAILIVPRWQEYSASQTNGAQGVAGPPSTVEQGALEPQTTSASPAGIVERRADGRGSLHVVAERGDCWLELRDQDEEGRVLFANTLARGRSVTLPGTSFWMRMGAGQNLSVHLGRRELLNLPGGAATVSIAHGTVDVLELG